MNLYYIEYKFENVTGELYVTDTGFGFLELGCVESGNVYDDNSRLLKNLTMESYLSNFTGDVLSCTKVL